MTILFLSELLGGFLDFYRRDFLGFYRVKSSVQDLVLSDTIFRRPDPEKTFFIIEITKSQINHENVQDSLQVKNNTRGSKVGSDPDPIFWIH